jgi:SAM-dependent methyltransferase
MYVRAFRRYSRDVHGVDLDSEKVLEAARELPNLRVAEAEALPYADNRFDVVLSHEVIEHVANDRQSLTEALRVLKSPDPCCGKRGGRLVVFAPNRLYPFETHGVYWRGHYHAGNIPLVNYLPDPWRSRFCPHVRAYTPRGLRQLLAGLPVQIVAHAQIYPGYDRIMRRRPGLGRWFRAATYFLEGTPLQRFGLSHFLVAEKTG